jgi:hypothetical protein
MDSISLEPLLQKFPEWRALVSPRTDQAGRDYLLVEVKPPASANVEHGLAIYTANDEVTVSFDTFHSHFREWNEEYESALEFIEQVVTERIAIVSWWFDDKWLGSSYVAAGHEPEHRSRPPRSNRIRVRSWKGTFNYDRFGDVDGLADSPSEQR